MICSQNFNVGGRGDFHTLYNGESVDDLVINFMEKHNIPGLSLAIVQAPYITRVVGYGLADIQTQRLVAANTVFNLGQLTKAYTAVAIMQIVEEGKLQLEQSLATYLTDTYIPKKWNDITIRDLMSHSSGLPDYTEIDFFDFSKEYSPREISTLIKDIGLLFTPGTKINFSATDFYLLGLVIERISGMSFQDYITKNQIDRIGLQHTFFISNLNTIKNGVENGMINPREHASGYLEENQSNVLAKSLSYSATFSNSSLVASAEDISTWEIALAGGLLVKKPQNRDFLYQSTTLKNGKPVSSNSGWFFPGHPGMMQIKGNVPGFSASLSRFTTAKELVCVTLLTNKEGILDLDILARKIAASFDIKLAAPLGAVWSETLQSPYSVQDTLNNVETIIKAKGGKIFARIDHSAEAMHVGLALQPTQVLIIGNPAKGTSIMEAKPSMALDLPLRIMATKDIYDQTWLSFTNPVELAKAYNLNDSKTISVLKQIESSLMNVCQKAILGCGITSSK
ncbi:D-alanyl-D-alanine carboxypeptidase precursor [Legionella massiliensis]|uniref:D-alanyl-D-alanine carboxypeptidase n=1 Tax=Legionella massiliensis TaxID=1034943 RepID=A0A078KTK4_9GAMM|nr:serine hydrolase [Legionella massiliensis]CDZ77810.1 D-alanyl-D-alanine carboxypeptidase precursor [Legionella massiliensis]CEE13548.1 D-alanyl-D-alanine carboxypeptidase precursor [Legionella massiliensis]